MAPLSPQTDIQVVDPLAPISPEVEPEDTWDLDLDLGVPMAQISPENPILPQMGDDVIDETAVAASNLMDLIAEGVELVNEDLMI